MFPPDFLYDLVQFVGATYYEFHGFPSHHVHANLMPMVIMMGMSYENTIHGLMKKFLHTLYTTMELDNNDLIEALMEDATFEALATRNQIPASPIAFYVVCNFDLKLPDEKLNLEGPFNPRRFYSTHLLKCMMDAGIEIPCKPNNQLSSYDEWPFCKSFYKMPGRDLSSYLTQLSMSTNDTIEICQLLRYETGAMKAEVLERRGLLTDANMENILHLTGKHIARDNLFIYKGKFPYTWLVLEMKMFLHTCPRLCRNIRQFRMLLKENDPMLKEIKKTHGLLFINFFAYMAQNMCHFGVYKNLDDATIVEKRCQFKRAAYTHIFAEPEALECVSKLTDFHWTQDAIYNVFKPRFWNKKFPAILALLRQWLGMNKDHSLDKRRKRAAWFYHGKDYILEDEKTFNFNIF